MKNVKSLVFAAAFLFVSGMLLAEEGAKPQDGKGPRGPQAQGPREDLKTSCPDCQGLVDRIKAKREEIKDLMEKAKPLHEAAKAKREAEEKARLEELKQKDPKKYEEEIAKMEERKKEQEKNKDGKEGEKREGPKDGKERPKPSKEQIEKMKKDNPELYDLMSGVEAKRKEIKDLRDQLKTCEDNCKSKK